MRKGSRDELVIDVDVIPLVDEGLGNWATWCTWVMVGR